MDAIQQQPLQVTFNYPVVFTTGLFAGSNPTLLDVIAHKAADSPARVLFVVDRGSRTATRACWTTSTAIAPGHAAALAAAGPSLVIAGGEPAKNDPRLLEQHPRTRSTTPGSAGTPTWSRSAAARCSTWSGYAAATAHRGVRLIRVPTTVLAQDDSAVGVKNGVNAFGKKNYLGTFAPPFAVINDFALPADAVRSRLARRHLGSDQGRR